MSQNESSKSLSQKNNDIMAKALNSAQECRPHVNHWPEGTQLPFQSTIFSFPTGWYLYWPPISRPYTFTNWTRHLGAFDLLWTLWLSLLSSWPITPTQALRHWDKHYSSTLNVLIAIRQTFCQVKDTSCSHIFWINTEICFFLPNPLVTFIVIIWNRD